MASPPRLARLVATAAILTALITVVAPASPASAAVGVTSSGTTATVTITGAETVHFACTAGALRVNGNPATPSVSCAALTTVQITGDAGAQTVWAGDLGYAAFTAHPHVIVSLGGGNDVLTDTEQADTIDLGGGDDQLYVTTNGPANVLTAMGPGTADHYTIRGSASPETITASSTTNDVTVSVTTGVSTRSRSASGVEDLTISGGDGNDTINTSGITAASAIDELSIDGEGGANVLTSTSISTTFFADGGHATFTGSPDVDSFWSSDPSDVIHGGGGSDYVYDYLSLRSGGRTYDGGTNALWLTQLHGGDAVARIRPGAAPGTATLVASLRRPGIQALPTGVSRIDPDFTYAGEKPDLALLDVVIPGTQSVSAMGDQWDDDLADVTVPAGTWKATGTLGQTYTVTPDDPAYGRVVLRNFTKVSIHGPWTNSNAGFAHRVTRDLVFRFLTPQALASMTAQLGLGTLTRDKVAHALIFSDEYRGLDVDRAFRTFLHREPDAGGRAYWISAIAGGRSLQKFRAQLVGSNEYFTKAGGTNSAFVTRAYTDILGRAPDKAGKDYWVHKLDLGTDRGTVAEAFLATAEARRAIVRDQYLRFLDHLPSDVESDYWVGVLGTMATGEQDLIQHLVTSTTYYQRS